MSVNTNLQVATYLFGDYVDPEELQDIVAVCESAEQFSLVEAKKRIPDHIKNNPYSVNALWSYFARTHHDPEGETCIYCDMFDGKTFTGDQLRTVFPDHYWEGDDIYPNVHKTLWNRESQCACLLSRDDTKWGEPANLDMWSSIGIDWTKGPEDKEE